MHIGLKRVLKVLVVIIPISTVIVLGVYVVSDFTEKIMTHINSSKDKEIEKYIRVKKENGKVWADNIVSLFDFKYKLSQENIKKELQNTIDIAFENAHKINKKHSKRKSKKQITDSIKSELSKMKYDSTSTPVFLVDYKGNTILGSNSKVDMDARTILLEEIQKVRRRGGGFITSRVDESGTKRYILVKDLGINDLFIGTDIYVKAKGGDLKNAFLDISKNTLLDSNDCVTVSEGEKNIYSSPSCREENEHTYRTYSKVLDLRLSYTFYSSKKIETENRKITALKELF